MSEFNPLGLGLRPGCADMPLLYLACPYSDPDVQVRHWRESKASKMAARLVAEGYAVFSPISHGHTICETAPQGGIGTDADSWARVNEGFLRMCDALVVLGLPGIAQSAGVVREMELAEALGLPVTMIAWRGRWVVQPVDAALFTAEERP